MIEERVAVDGLDVVELAKRLIAIESHALADGREGAIGRFLVDWFSRHGIDAGLQPVIDGRANVIARIPGDDGPSLMLCGHLDTVPAGDMADAFVPRVEEGVLWGRGACDMKGAVAAMCCAMAAMVTAEDARRPSGDLVFAGTVDEESGGLGVKGLVDAGVRTEYAVVGEPTNLHVARAHKGACFVRVTLSGRGAHGSCPERGVSAVSYASKIVRAIEEDLRPRLAARTHPLLGTSTVSVGRLCGGTQPNIVAELCEIDIDRRTIPGESYTVAELRALVAGQCDGVEGLEYTVTEMPMTSVVPHTPLETPKASAMVDAALGSLADTGRSGEEPVGVTYWTDGSHLADQGIETIVLGPGDIAHAHGPAEHVAVGDLQTAVRVYRGLADRLVGERS